MQLNLLSILVLFFTGVNCSLTTEYYENLIKERTSQAQAYELPEKNLEFKLGAESDRINDFGSYDFIIVGAGSAGSVLATRLSEIDHWKILLLEAGGEEDDFSNIPAMAPYLQFSEMNWGYFSTPQTRSCLGMKDRQCIVPRGKAVGGSSAINGIMYVRGNPRDYDKWAEFGNSGWSYEEVLPYFIKSENSQIDGDSGYHGKGGMWNVEYSLPPSVLLTDFINGNVELNASVVDYNGRNQFGVGKMQFNTKRGRRQSTGTAFLSNARKRGNLHVVTKALVTKIKIDRKSKVAKGVEFVTKNQKFSVTASKEIILSGGAINSPQLLMLSGIGPKCHLEELGIEVIADLPVGKNLLDHPFFPALVFHTNYTWKPQTMDGTIDHYLNGLGVLTNSEHVDAVGFIQVGNRSSDVPGVEYIFGPPVGGDPSFLSKVFNYNDEITQNFFGKVNTSTDVIFYLSLLHERSRGQITLKSANPIDFPNVDLNMFAESEDVNDFVEGIEFVMNLTKTEAFRKINAELVDFPICTEFSRLSKPYWGCIVRHLASTLYHPCGTTAMGSNKATSVVDANLKVHGIKRLRVVDAGVIPSTISGHTNAPVVMVAEKIADVIKNGH